MKKRVLVTGGAGFVGSHIRDRLLAKGCDKIIEVDNMVRGRPAHLASALPSGRVDLVEVAGDASIRDLVAWWRAETCQVPSEEPVT
jgi:nucleoside-diphosphate-sugar epimerase